MTMSCPYCGILPIFNKVSRTLYGFVCSYMHVSVSMHMCMSMWSHAFQCSHVNVYAVTCMSMWSRACLCGHVHVYVVTCMSMWSCVCGHVHVYVITCMSMWSCACLRKGSTHMSMSTSTCWQGDLEHHSSGTAHLFVFWDKVSSWARTYQVG